MRMVQSSTASSPVGKRQVFLKGCRHCGGDLYSDDGYTPSYGHTGMEYRCLQCGRPRSDRPGVLKRQPSTMRQLAGAHG